jgi:hypothetical protein
VAVCKNRDWVPRFFAMLKFHKSQPANVYALVKL